MSKYNIFPVLTKKNSTMGNNYSIFVIYYNFVFSISFNCSTSSLLKRDATFFGAYNIYQLLFHYKMKNCNQEKDLYFLT